MELAAQLGVKQTTVSAWENGHGQPRYGGPVDQILGITTTNPVLAHRRRLSLRPQRLAQQLNINPSTLWGWEQGERVLPHYIPRLIEAFGLDPLTFVDELDAAGMVL